MPQESNDTYSHIHHDTITGRGASKKSREGTVAEDVEMGEYSSGDKPQEQVVGADLRSQTCAEIGVEKGKAVTGDDRPTQYGNKKTYENINVGDEGPHAAPA